MCTLSLTNSELPLFPLYKLEDAKKDKTIYTLPREIWQIIFNALPKTDQLKNVSQFAFTCKTAFNLVFHTLKPPSLIFAVKMWRVSKGQLIAAKIRASGALGLTFSITFLAHGPDQKIYFAKNNAEGSKSSALLIYDLLTHTHQEIELKDFLPKPPPSLFKKKHNRRAKQNRERIANEISIIMQCLFTERELIVITKAGYARFSTETSPPTFIGFYSPFEEGKILTVWEKIHRGRIEGDTLHLVIEKFAHGEGETSDGEEPAIINYSYKSFSLSHTKPGFSIEGKESDLSVNPKYFTSTVRLDDNDEASNSEWKVQMSLYETLKVYDKRLGKELSIKIPNTFKRPLFRLAHDFLFLFERPSESRSKKWHCCLFYLPTLQRVTHWDPNAFFHLPKDNELFDLFLKTSNRETTLVYFTHKIGKCQGNRGGSYTVFEVAFTPPSLEDTPSDNSDSAPDVPLDNNNQKITHFSDSSSSTTTAEEEAQKKTVAAPETVLILDPPSGPNWKKIAGVVGVVSGSVFLILSGAALGALFGANMGMVVALSVSASGGSLGAIMIIAGSILWAKSKRKI